LVEGEKEAGRDGVTVEQLAWVGHAVGKLYDEVALLHLGGEVKEFSQAAHVVSCSPMVLRMLFGSCSLDPCSGETSTMRPVSDSDFVILRAPAVGIG
jgi:hypothetical protein